MRRHGKAQPQHLVGHLSYLPLGTLAAPQLKEIHQAAGIHGHYHLGITGIGQHKPCVLYGGFLRPAGGRLGAQALGQQLLFPERLAFSENEYALLEENAVDFAALGFDLEFCGGGAVEVKGVPADIPHDTIDRLIYELLQEFAVPVDVQALRREKIAAVMACSGARSMSRTISTEEAESLLGQLCEGGNVSFTPSGKAVMAEIWLIQKNF